MPRITEAKALVQRWRNIANGCKSAATTMLDMARNIESEFGRMMACDMLRKYDIIHSTGESETEQWGTIEAKLRHLKRTADGKNEEADRYFTWCLVVESLFPVMSPINAPIELEIMLHSAECLRRTLAQSLVECDLAEQRLQRMIRYTPRDAHAG